MNQKDLIVLKVDDLHNAGTKKEDAFKLVAEELEITISACKNIYYYYRNKPEKRKVMKFSNKEEDFIIDTILDFFSRGKKVKEAISYCADKLGVNPKQVRPVWERERDKRGLKTRERDTNPWTEENDKIVVDTLIEESHKGRILTDVFPEIDKVLNRKEGSTKSRWNNILRHHHDNKIKKSYFEWDDQKDKILLEAIQKSVVAKKPLQDAFDEVVEILQEPCTINSCQKRYKEKFMDRKFELNIRVGLWTEKENEILKNIMEEERQKGSTDWDAAYKAEEILNRPHGSCLSHWNYHFNPDIRNMPRWTEEEDLILIKCVKESATKVEGYRKAAKLLKDRSYHSCSQRYDNKLKDKIIS